MTEPIAQGRDGSGDASRERILHLEGIHKTFGTFNAVRGVDLTVHAGEICGFLGPNGAGKTTTLRIIAGLLQPTAGRVEVCGADAKRHPLEAKKHIAFIGDRPHLYEKLTGKEFLRFVGGLWGMTPQAIAKSGTAWLARFDLTSWAGEPVESYSHGMRQRLLLCSALLHRPRLLILDEPMVGLDPRGAAHLKKVMRELADKEHLAILVSTHTLDLVEKICDTIAIIDRGKLVTSGALDDVRRRHRAEGQRLEELFLQITDRATREEDPPPPDNQDNQDNPDNPDNQDSQNHA